MVWRAFDLERPRPGIASFAHARGAERGRAIACQGRDGGKLLLKSAKSARLGDREVDKNRPPSTYRYVVYYRRIATVGATADAAVESQRAAVQEFIKDQNVLAEFVENIVGSRPDRPAFGSAVAFCRQHNARLVIAELGRLVRSAIFTGLLRDAGVEFVALDNAYACPGNIGSLAEAAARKTKQTGHRISVALAVARAAGAIFGNPQGAINLRRYAVEAREKAIAVRRARAASRARGLAGLIDEIRASGASSLSQVAIELNRRGVPAPRGGRWRSIQVQRTLTQLAW
jgi:DNA invertase Pin-like site-specific DNA recombinase